MPTAAGSLRASLAGATGRLAARSLARLAGSSATQADLFACYRLLLGRSPETGALEHYGPRLARGELSAEALAGEVMASDEFRSRHRHLLEAESSVVQKVETPDFVLYVDLADWAVGRPIARSGSYEPSTDELLRSLVSSGDTVVDVGANVGWFSMLAARLVGPAGRVLAVEPNPANCRLIERSAAENGFTGVTVLPVAASDRSGMAALETDGSNGRMVLLDRAPPTALSCSFVVPLERLDELVGRAGLERVDVLKIDVEGAEALVLRGASGTIARHRPAIVCEVFPALMRATAGIEPRSFLAELRQLGYRLSVVGGGQDLSDDAIVSMFGDDAGLEHIDVLATPARASKG